MSHIKIKSYIQDNTGNDVPAVLVDPTLPAIPLDGEYVVQEYDDGIVFSIRNAGAWVNVHVAGGGGAADGRAISQSNAGNNVPGPLVDPTVIATPINGDVVIQTYDDGTVVSTREGGAWVNVQVVSAAVGDGEFQVQDNLGNDVPAVLVNPTAIATPIAGDAVAQIYDNGTVMSSFNGTVWTNRSLNAPAVAGDGETRQQDNTGGDAPAVLVDPTVIGAPVAGDAVLQIYDNATVVSTHNGTVWTNTLLPGGGTADGETQQQDNTGGNVPAVLVDPTGIATPVAGDAVMQIYDDASVFSTHDGTNWTNTQLPGGGTDANMTYNDLTGNNLPAAAVDPVLPAAPIAGDSAIQEYDNGVVISTHDGTNWTNVLVPNCCETVTINSVAGQTPITNAPANPLEGDTFLNDADTLVWIFDGTVWQALPNAGDDAANYVQDNTGNNIPAVLVDPTVVGAPINGDQVIQRYDDGFVISTRSAGAWINVGVSGGVNSQARTQDNTGGNIPAVLVDPTTPATPITGDSTFQQYDNGVVLSTFDGTNWTNVAITEAGDGEAQQQDNTGGNAPAVLVDPTAIAAPIAGDIVFQIYDDATIVSTHDGTNWTNVRLPGGGEDGETQQQIIAGDAPAAAVDPTVIAAPIAGDSVIQVYDDKAVISTHDGTNWTNTFLPNCCETVTINAVTGENPTTNPPTDPAEGDEFLNTADDLSFIFDGTIWVQRPGGGHPTPLVGTALPAFVAATHLIGTEFMVQDANGETLHSYISDGTAWVRVARSREKIEVPETAFADPDNQTLAELRVWIDANLTDEQKVDTQLYNTRASFEIPGRCTAADQNLVVPMGGATAYVLDSIDINGNNHVMGITVNDNGDGFQDAAAGAAITAALVAEGFPNATGQATEFGGNYIWTLGQTEAENCDPITVDFNTNADGTLATNTLTITPVETTPPITSPFTAENPFRVWDIINDSITPFSSHPAIETFAALPDFDPSIHINGYTANVTTIGTYQSNGFEWVRYTHIPQVVLERLPVWPSARNGDTYNTGARLRINSDIQETQVIRLLISKPGGTTVGTPVLLSGVHNLKGAPYDFIGAGDGEVNVVVETAGLYLVEYTILTNQDYYVGVGGTIITDAATANTVYGVVDTGNNFMRPTTNVNYGLDVDNSYVQEYTEGFTRYAATIQQTLANAPVVVEVQNNSNIQTGGIVVTRTGVGVYAFTAANPIFAANQYIATFQKGFNSGTGAIHTELDAVSNTVLELRTFAADGVTPVDLQTAANTSSIEIKFYS